MNTSTQMRALARRVTAVAAIVLFAQTAGAVSPADAAGTVTVGVTQEVLALGQRVGVKGTTGPAGAHTKVAVERRMNATTWSTRAVGRTDSGGRFFVPIQPSQIGIYALRIRSTVGYSPVFYIRVLGPLVVDKGGLQTLRLGMTLEQAKATHWITGTTGPLCTTGGCWTQGDVPSGIPVEVIFDGFRIGTPGTVYSIILRGSGSTVEGVRIGSPSSLIDAVYRLPAWLVQWSAEAVPHGARVSRAGPTWPGWALAYLFQTTGRATGTVTGIYVQ